MNAETPEYRETFSRVIAETLGQAVRIVAASPALVVPGTVILHHQRKAANLRRAHERTGLLVPPVLIASITSRCNLACAGCYMQGRGEQRPEEMSAGLLESVANQAAGLGISVFVIAGGEPLIRMEEIFRMAKAHPAILFPVFTNGLLIDEVTANVIAGCRNIVPIISFEGSREDTDRRRGAGVYDRLLGACSRLRNRNAFFGCSITTTRENFDRVTDRAFVRQMIAAGVRAFTFVEYVPMAPGTENLILTPGQKKTLNPTLSGFNTEFPALFVGFPGDEDVYGGCLAAGRGFVHISPSGDLEPCPAAPVSDSNLATVSLEDALRSRLLARIRDEHGILTETGGGCALRANRVWVQGLLDK
jgi:MoaA/NifB/PqqE/SkfB family radical SAM enzyme